MPIIRKTIYASEYFQLAREQYKRKPYFGALMRELGARKQELENILFSFVGLREAPSSVDVPLGVLRDRARGLGLPSPEGLSLADLQLEVKAVYLTLFASGVLDDFRRISSALFGFNSHVVSYAGAVEITVYGDISSTSAALAKADLIWRTAKRMVPAGVQLAAVNEASPDSFGFSGMARASSFSGGLGTGGFARLVRGV